MFLCVFIQSLEECESHGLPPTEQGRSDLEMKIEESKENIRKAEVCDFLSPADATLSAAWCWKHFCSCYLLRGVWKGPTDKRFTAVKIHSIFARACLTPSSGSFSQMSTSHDKNILLIMCNPTYCKHRWCKNQLCNHIPFHNVSCWNCLSTLHCQYYLDRAYTYFMKWLHCRALIRAL